MNDELEQTGGEAAADEIATLRARLVQAELRTEAVRAGMGDLDGVKRLDISGLGMGENGIAGGAELLGRLRDAKPWLFGRGGASSSSTGRAPAAVPPKPKTAMEMSDEEWRAARAELLRRR